MSDVIPAQIQQLPGRDFTYDTNPNAFEAILGGVGAFLNAQAQRAKESEQRRSTEMGQAFAALVARGMVETGAAPKDRQGFMYGGSPFYYTQPGDPSRVMNDKTADVNKTLAETYRIQQETGQVPTNPEAMLPQLIKSQTSSPGFAVASINDPVAAGSAAVRSAYAMLDEMEKQKSGRPGAQPGQQSGKAAPTSSGKAVQQKASAYKVGQEVMYKGQKRKVKKVNSDGTIEIE